MVHDGSEPTEVTAEVVMKDKAFHITRGEMWHYSAESEQGFLLRADTHADIRLRNEDTVAHEFVSTMLNKVPFQFSSTGTLVKLPGAAGVRVGPGQTVVLSFEVPKDGTEFQNIYEAFWCNVHGKVRGDKMRGEILIVGLR